MKTLILFSVLIILSSGFLHGKPGEPCVVRDQDLPIDANSTNTYDWIFVGSGAVSGVTASRLANLTNCQTKILVIEAGRSYTKDVECSGEIDCYVKGVENDQHLIAGTTASSVYLSKGTWNYVSEPQTFSNQILYSNPTAGDSCPFNEPEYLTAFPSNIGCNCTSNWANNGPGAGTCAPSFVCLLANGNNKTLCGDLSCSKEYCAVNGTTWFGRSTGKGGSNSHNGLFSYKISPFNAGKWVEATGDTRYAWEKWEKALGEMMDDWMELSFVNDLPTPSFTHENDTLLALLRKAYLEETGLNDLGAPNNIKTKNEWIDPLNSTQVYYQGFYSDYNIGRQVRFSDGKRSFPSWYLDRIMGECGSEIYDVKCDSFVTKILFNDQNGQVGRRAIGIEYITGGNNFFLDTNYNETEVNLRLMNPIKAYAKRGVILSNNVFETPKLLMLSGIGEEQQLNNFNITIRKVLPAVGKNVKDDFENALHYRIAASGDPFAANSTIFEPFTDINFYVPYLYKALWGYNASSFNTTTGFPIAPIIPTGIFCHPDAPTYGGRACPIIPNFGPVVPPDPAYLEYVKGNINPYSDGAFASMNPIFTYFSSQEVLENDGNPDCLSVIEGSVFNSWSDLRVSYGGQNQTIVAVHILLTRVSGNGEILLATNNPVYPPKINPNYFSNQDDLNRMAKCINVARRIFENINKISEENPGLYGDIKLTEYKSAPFSVDPTAPKDVVSEKLKDYAKSAVFSHHPQGSNRMGKREDINSVTDSFGRVWDTSNLYVIDGASFPAQVDFFPAIPSMVFGWLQADPLSQFSKTSTQCIPNSFVGARGIDDLDAEGNPLLGAVIALAVVILILLIIFGVVLYMGRRRPPMAFSESPYYPTKRRVYRKYK